MDEARERKGGITRRKLVGSAAVAAPALLLAKDPTAFSGTRAAANEAKRWPQAGMNVILFLTDQERAIQNFPPGWSTKNLPGMTRLRRHGLTFHNAFTNACMCSPARSTLLTGYFPAQHGSSTRWRRTCRPTNTRRSRCRWTSRTPPR